ncbi:transcriptional repressor CTCF-like isoform X2 [Phymastichus coffea]|uniref:transcriptional repressor CTCF-like isoform X2 n=1 Tax=Phymastichus coffea TaxID=108790 RepID=UPI00273B777E|nr:transcriptional repressor CTCF-like isoform X2 [Phymastichus coffea]
MILQSDPVKRLFNQPNIVIHAIPRTNSPTAYRMIRPKPFADSKTDNNNTVQQLSEKTELSVKVVHSKENTIEEENLLPSKSNGKSEILLVPIVRTRKDCGHFEPCESLVCDVIVQQYEDEEGITPLISINIEDDEIDAPAAKHCENKNCDALSIDHNRCRRALIQLYHCDKHSVCDICEVTLTNTKARLNHKKCRRKAFYQYNIASPTEIFKLRMRERELQILEAAKLKRSEDYLDPVKGFSRTMEALMKKDELIIIPKMPPPDYKPLIPNSAYKKQIFSNLKKNKKHFKKRKMESQNNSKELTSEMISDIIKSCQNYIINKNLNEKNKVMPTKKIMLSDHFNGATVNIMNVSQEAPQDCITLNDLSGINSIAIDNQQQTNLIAKEKSLNNVNLNLLEQSKPKPTESLSEVEKPTVKEAEQSQITSSEVVPIAELKSQPSAQHQQQGVPNSCDVPDTATMVQLAPQATKSTEKEKRVPKLKNPESPSKSLKTSKVLTSGKFRPLLPSLANAPRNLDVKISVVLLSRKKRGRKRLRKKIIKGKFKCTHCSKRFSTLDYCKLHIAKHENNPGFFCRLCEKGFLNKYIMNKHIDADHKPGEVRCEVCSSILPSLRDLSRHLKRPEKPMIQDCPECSETFDTCNTLDVHLRKEHGFLICTLCNRQVTKSKVCRHLILEHSLSRNRSEKNIDKLYKEPSEEQEVRELDLVEEVVPSLVKEKREVVIKTDPVSEAKVEAKTVAKTEAKIEVDCLARNRSIRRRSSKELFVCSVCDRRFENEKQYQIHLSNNPMKFTLCPVCSKKFHRKSEYTEHSKTCSQYSETLVTPAPKRKKSSATKADKTILKSENVIASKNSIDQKRNENLGLKNCKKLKLNDDKIVQKDDKQEDGNILKINVENKIANGLKSECNDCLENLKIIEIENNVEKKNDNDVIIHDKNQVILLNSMKTKLNSNESEPFDASRAMTNIIQDHNYLA